MALDAILLFCEQMNQVVGIETNRLFGLEGVSLKKSEIYVNLRKGISCSNEHSANYSEIWPLGKFILNNILNVINLNKYLMI
jgi:hypothetical protein